MKKILYFAGFGTLLYGGYLYFKHQIDLALNYDYNIDDIKILQLNDERADVKVDVRLSNKSAFEIEILNYDLELFYKDKSIAKSASGVPFKIYAENSVTITAVGTVLFDDAVKALAPFVADVLRRKPIDIEISGSVKVKFLGIPNTITFNKEKFNYSMDLLKDLGLSERYEKLQQRFSFLRKI